MADPGNHLFALLSRDDVWTLDRGRRRHVESRVAQGVARYRSSRPAAVEATDSLSDLGPEAGGLHKRLEALVSQAAGAVGEIRSAHRVFARTVCSVRKVTADDRHDVRDAITIALTVARGGERLSAVTSPQTLREELRLVENAIGLDPAPATARESLPILWTGGSAAVLFHEAIGHPAEHEHAPIAWPLWLHVIDDPSVEGFGTMNLDDTGAPVSPRELTMNHGGFAWRRESFRDAPLPRMTNLIVRQEAAPFALPDARIEIRLLAGGRYEPLTETVTLNVAVAERVDGQSRSRLAPFELRASRTAIAASVLGGSGEPMRYPGVVCSAEGQEIVVGSFAPLILTAALDE